MTDAVSRVQDVLQRAAGELVADGQLVMNVVMVFDVLDVDGVSTELRTCATAMPWWTANGLLEAGKSFD